ncbi:TPA: DUF1835 domain-containing protein [Serratia marcescens]|uniref:DUF1835 domain-containing protein n=1 Tax=Serratia ureilytica TaxID=300181 RepID=UPI0018DA1BF5|nr:DUF1835 domain-containing protein [Serratia ureilytica]MBH2928675.1 DUF1835 domain-containing protein [Serratia ureilytica]
MQPRIRHVCQAGSAQALLEALFDTGVTGIADDCTLGPLIDVDAPSPHQRIAFWHDVFARAYGDTHTDWSARFYSVYQQLNTLSEHVDEIVIWSGSHPVEQLLRRRVYWWLRDKSVNVTEIPVDTRDKENPSGRHHAAVAQISADRLQLRFAERRPVSITQCRQRADEWVTLRDQGIGIRIIDNSLLTERPIAYFDVCLLSIVAARPIRLNQAIGQAMSETGMTDTFCQWRYTTLIASGELTLISGNLHDGSGSAMIGRSSAP